MEKLDPHTLLEEMQNSTYHCFGKILKRLNRVTIGPNNSTPRYKPTRNENMSPHKTCTEMFITLFIITEKWKQPNVHSSTNGGTKCGIDHTLEYCINTCYNMNDLCYIMPSRRRQSPNTTYCVIPFIWNVLNRQICSNRKQISVCLGLEQGEQARDEGNDNWQIMGTRFLSRIF